MGLSAGQITVRSTVRLHIRPLARKHKPKRKLNVKVCRDPSVEDALQQSVAEKLAAIADTDASSIKDTATLTADWTSVCDCLKEAAVETIGHCDKKHQDLFDDNNGTIRVLLRAKKRGACCKATQSTLSHLTRQVEGSPIYSTEGTASHGKPMVDRENP